jgi:hypothetical protein
MDNFFTMKNGAKKDWGKERLIAIDQDALLELIRNYSEVTNELGDKIDFEARKNSFLKEKKEFARRMNFLATIRQNLII